MYSLGREFPSLRGWMQGGVEGVRGLAAVTSSSVEMTGFVGLVVAALAYLAGMVMFEGARRFAPLRKTECGIFPLRSK